MNRRIEMFIFLLFIVITVYNSVNVDARPSRYLGFQLSKANVKSNGPSDELISRDSISEFCNIKSDGIESKEMLIHMFSVDLFDGQHDFFNAKAVADRLGDLSCKNKFNLVDKSLIISNNLSRMDSDNHFNLFRVMHIVLQHYVWHDGLVDAFSSNQQSATDFINQLVESYDNINSSEMYEPLRLFALTTISSFFLSVYVSSLAHEPTQNTQTDTIYQRNNKNTNKI
eukprot:GHVR01156187.1.p1 GENE.GHVR01156187.1~~GHVR01156187.1.p1  ORF type:complete len:227 (+),score=19.95 GHVR01156187.1:2-682(+)